MIRLLKKVVTLLISDALLFFGFTLIVIGFAVIGQLECPSIFEKSVMMIALATIVVSFCIWISSRMEG